MPRLYDGCDVGAGYVRSNTYKIAGTLSDAAALKEIFQSFHGAKITVKGQCDQRGFRGIQSRAGPR
jgi:hypothetical protein